MPVGKANSDLANTRRILNRVRSPSGQFCSIAWVSGASPVAKIVNVVLIWVHLPEAGIIYGQLSTHRGDSIELCGAR